MPCHDEQGVSLLQVVPEGSCVSLVMSRRLSLDTYDSQSTVRLLPFLGYASLHTLFNEALTRLTCQGVWSMTVQSATGFRMVCSVESARCSVDGRGENRTVAGTCHCERKHAGRWIRNVNVKLSLTFRQDYSVGRKT